MSKWIEYYEESSEIDVNKLMDKISKQFSEKVDFEIFLCKKLGITFEEYRNLIRSKKLNKINSSNSDYDTYVKNLPF